MLCKHEVGLKPVPPRTPAGCEEWLPAGTAWGHLRLCPTCGRDPRFFVIKAGDVEIVDVSGDQPKTVTVHGPGAFTGDVSQVTGQPALVSAVARTDGEAYEVSPDALREMLNNHPDLGDLVMQAFIARRQLLTGSGGITGVRVIRSRYSPH